MKGIILAGGSGTRLYPITQGISKHLIPIYDKPMIYYPLSVLMLAGIREVLIITNPEFMPHYKSLLGDGSKLGMTFEFIIQKEAKGIADAFIIGEEFIADDHVCLVLGDNFFYGQGFQVKLIEATKLENGSIIFGYSNPNLEESGVVEFDEDNNVLSLEEKPTHSKSSYAIPGLYFYDNSVIEKAKNITRSKRGEFEITDINHKYLEEDTLKVELLNKEFTWLDMGDYDRLLKTSNYVQTMQKRTGFYIGCIEEIAYNNKWITKDELIDLGKKYEKTDYGKYLLHIAKGV